MDVWGIPVLAEIEDILASVKEELIKNEIELLRDIKPTVDNIMVTCISHGDGQERNPSLGVLTVNTKGYKGEIVPAGTCHCFTCGYTADLPTFISNCFGYNDAGMYGYRWIMKNFVSVQIDSRPNIEVSMARETEKSESEDKIISEEELQKYRYYHPYMYERKLTNKVIDYFDIGYDKQTNSITFPVHDLEGNVRLIQRRSVQGKTFINDEGGNKGNYIYGLRQVYNNLDWVRELFVTESPLDALTLWTYRIPAVALMGATITKQQIDLLNKVPIRKIILALDNDNAGINASKNIKIKLSETKVLHSLVYPEGIVDVNDMTAEQINSINLTLL